MNKISISVTSLILAVFLLGGCKSSLEKRESAQRESEKKPIIFEDSLFIKGKLAGRIVNWGGISDSKPELQQKYFDLLIGNYKIKPGFSEIFPYEECGRDTRATSGSEIYDLKGNLKLVIIKDIVDSKLCKDIGMYIVLGYEKDGKNFIYRPEKFLNFFRGMQDFFDNSYSYGLIISKHEELFTLD
ncbi:hypothetical protein AB3N58_17860 (plasmid) [Leptospira sp. WS60.C2]